MSVKEYEKGPALSVLAHCYEQGIAVDREAAKYVKLYFE